MQSIKNVSRNGRTVMVTIHQPSIDIFESFDALVLLQRGGKVSPIRLCPAVRYLPNQHMFTVWQVGSIFAATAAAASAVMPSVL